MRTADRGEEGNTLHYVKSSLEEPKGRGKHRLMALRCFHSTLPCSRQHPLPDSQSSGMSMATQQGQRQPVLCVQQLCLLETLGNKMTRKGWIPSPILQDRMRAENISPVTSPTLWRRLGLSQEAVWSQEHREQSGVWVYRGSMVRPTGQPLELASLPLIFSGIY